jgi:hypothetical protein
MNRRAILAGAGTWRPVDLGGPLFLRLIALTGNLTMARGPCNFRQRDVKAAVKAVIAAGCEGSRVEIDPATGKIVIVVTKSQAAVDDVAGENEWDQL